MFTPLIAAAIIAVSPATPDATPELTAQPEAPTSHQVVVDPGATYILDVATASSTSAEEIRQRQAAANAQQMRAAGLVVSADATTVAPLPAGYKVTSGWNLHRVHPVHGSAIPHRGIDLAAPVGTPVLAAQDGVVIANRGCHAGCMDGQFEVSGYVVAIDHGHGVVTTYNHNLAPSHLNVGDQVLAGDQIAQIGLSGHTTGAHLHFQVLLDGQMVDPEPWLSSRGVALR